MIEGHGGRKVPGDEKVTANIELESHPRRLKQKGISDIPDDSCETIREKGGHHQVHCIKRSAPLHDAFRWSHCGFRVIGLLPITYLLQRRCATDHSNSSTPNASNESRHRVVSVGETKEGATYCYWLACKSIM